jgi:outer membrane protein assembly factor BamB
MCHPNRNSLTGDGGGIIDKAMNSLSFAVVPVIIGPLQVLIVILPAILLSLGGLIVGLLKPRAMWAGAKLLWRQKVAVAVFAGVVTGAVFMVRTFASHGGPTSEQIAGADWPMFRGDPGRRGDGGGNEPPADGGLLWSYADVKTFFASPAVVGNRVYVSSADKGPLRDRGAIYCLDADWGGLVWKAAPSGYVATFSSPVVAGRFLVCGEGLHYTLSARVFCMDVLQQKVLWTYTTHGHVESTPCIDKDRVYVGAGDDGYYCFRLEPDAEGRAVVLWHAPTERCPDADTSPAVHDARVVVGCGMHGNAICCLDADSGAELWRAATPYPVFGAPTLVGGRVVVGMGNGNFIESAEEVKRKELDKLRKQGKTAEELAAAGKTLGPAGEVWCLDEKTGQVQWKFAAGDVVLGAVAAAADRLFFAARDGYVYALSTAGKEVGRWNAHAPIVASPALSGGQLHVVTESGKLYALRADDLELVWETTLGFSGPFLSSPAVARGHVYVGSQQDGLLCVGKPGGRKQRPSWAGYCGGPGCGGNVDGQPLPEKGKYGWRFPQTEDTDQAPDLQIAAPPACLNGMLYVPVHGGRKGLVCLREDQKGKARAAEVWFAAARGGVTLSPAATAQEAFFVDGQKGDPGRNLHCLSAADGKEKWKLPVAADAPGDFVLTDEGGLIADGPGRLTAFGGCGQVTWQADCGAVCGVPVTSDAFVVLAADRPPELLVLDRPSGRALWRLPLGAAATAAPLLRKNVIYLGTPAGVAALRLADGQRIWETAGGRPATPLVLAKKRLAYTSAAGQVVIIALEEGRVEKTISGAVPGIPPLAVPESFVYAGRSGLMSCSTGGDGPRSWMNSNWLGRFTCAPVMADSRIYVATDKKGLVCLKGK